MKKSVWIAEEEVNKIGWVKKYNKACKKWQDKSPDDISLFYSYFTIKEHQKFLSIDETRQQNNSGRDFHNWSLCWISYHL